MRELYADDRDIILAATFNAAQDGKPHSLVGNTGCGTRAALGNGEFLIVCAW